ncbi:MAG: sugar-binding domain-containing protein [Bacteroidota bacterium]
MKPFAFALMGFLFLYLPTKSSGQTIPLPEHPRPDFERKVWQNLNGQWAFEFDKTDVGKKEKWYDEKRTFSNKINVPFPWGSQLSGLEDEADIGWYQRTIRVDKSWRNKRTFLTVGASDWETTVWLDGQLIGQHQGGYVPFSFELTDFIQYGKKQNLVIRVDDARRDFTLYGKQGYGNARGIWQTIYLEARGTQYLDAIHFTPDIDDEKVDVTVYLPEAAKESLTLDLQIKEDERTIDFQTVIPKEKQKIDFSVDLPNPKLWSLDTPNLYFVKATLSGKKSVTSDEVYTYFGMRKISVEKLPNTNIPYVALNNKPIYLQLALDQSYHPEGFYTFPSDQFLQEEIMRSKSIGLNGIRTHIKVEIPRKLYWADKLGLLVMEDLPNSWGEPDEKMRNESTYTLKEMIKRDYNHPSIFSWVVFNETWGLFTKTGENANGKPIREYLPSTQNWVASMYYLAKSLDGSRIVEDNSICCGRGHTETDLYSWHVYLPGYAWNDYLDNLTANNYPGSSFDFEEGFTQRNQPNINSECGNVWGYEGSTGDVDWSWDYHRMINTFRQYPKVGGWLYTEHHDVINEWNGYWRFDRSEKETGLGKIVEGMTLNDLHADIYLSTGNEICRTVKGGRMVEVPLFLSSMTDKNIGESVDISSELEHTNYLGQTTPISTNLQTISYQPYMQKQLQPMKVTLPNISGVSTLKLKLLDASGNVLQRNFMHFEVLGSEEVPDTKTISLSANDFSDADWSKKQWEVLDGKKVNGAGKGFFEYTFAIPANLAEVKNAYFLVEASAKELFIKDQESYDNNQDFMKGSRVAPSSNPNSYPMSDETMYPSDIIVSVNGKKALRTTLKDDPADHRGVLSWHNQLKDRKLREAGSYGYLIRIPLNISEITSTDGVNPTVKVKIATAGENGIAIYGKDFGRYMIDPSLVFEY